MVNKKTTRKTRKGKSLFTQGFKIGKKVGLKELKKKNPRSFSPGFRAGFAAGVRAASAGEVAKFRKVKRTVSHKGFSKKR